MKIITKHPVASDSQDHINPMGIRQDNTKCPAFLNACRRVFYEPRFLDLGCGGGGLVREFLDAGYVAYGIDGSDYARVNRLAEWPVIPGHLMTADLTKPLEYQGEQFTVIGAFELMEHIRESDLPQFFDNVKKFLHPDGLFVTSIAFFPHGEWHVTLRDREWWENKFIENGFDSIHLPIFAISEMPRGSGNPLAVAGDWSGNAGTHLVCRKKDLNKPVA